MIENTIRTYNSRTMEVFKHIFGKKQNTFKLSLENRVMPKFYVIHGMTLGQLRIKIPGGFCVVHTKGTFLTLFTQSTY